MASRISQISQHLDPRTWSKGLAQAKVKGADDVVIISYGRTPYCKAKKGGLKDASFDQLCLETFRGILAKSGIDPSLVQEVAVGNCRNVDNAYDIRAAALAAGLPNTSPTLVVNRFCSSGLMAVREVANQIQAGEIDCGLAAGVEHMSSHPSREFQFSPEIMKSNQEAADCVMPMGWTSENVAKDFGIPRSKMDAFAARSHQRAAAAQKAGKFDAEIFPVTVPSKGLDGNAVQKTIREDDGVRGSSTEEGLSKIKPAFPQWEPAQTTGGNASQVTDGGAAVLLMRRSKAEALGLKILGKYVATAVCGLEPRIMGIGPSLAIPKVLELTGIKQSEVDLFEINEAFASMAVYCEEKLGINPDQLNVNGGACAIGHPLGSTGARLVCTVMAELERRQQSVGVVSMCIGLGMGAAGIVIRE